MSSDDILVRQVQAGDAAAFDALFERYAPRIRPHLVRLVRDDAAADDLLQEVFLRLWTRAEQWEGRGTVSGWLTRVATNLALNHLRSVRRRRSQPLDLPKEPEDEDDIETAPGWMVDAAALGPDEVLEEAERRDALRRAVYALPEEQRQVLRMVHEAEMDIREVAAQLGIPSGTVKSRLHYAREELARGWEQLAKPTEDE